MQAVSGSSIFVTDVGSMHEEVEEEEEKEKRRRRT
jgi:hypothetical protein